MRFLKRLLGDSPPEDMASLNDAGGKIPFTDEEKEAHLSVARYGDFLLTRAIRPSFDLQITPRQGYRHDRFHDERAGAEIPVLMASASAERLFDLFLDLLDPLGEIVDVVLETSHLHEVSGHTDLFRHGIDLPVLKSTLYDFEDLLLHDGCTGIAVLNPALSQEVQFDEHKLLIVYGRPLHAYERILRRYGVPRIDDLRFVSEAEHLHASRDEYITVFERLQTELGVSDQVPT
ncbi:MAG: hypothetical protein U1A77_08120 [Pirellulales bacterium]